MAPLVGKSGNRIGRLILFDDVTQRMRMEEQVFQNEKLTSLGLLAAGVAHEVNTPLAVISNYIQMLAKQLPAGDPRQQLIEKVVKQTFRASEIVNNLLNFSRTGAAEFIEVDINNVLEETYEIHLRNHKESGSVEVRVPEHLFRWSNWEILNSSMPYTQTDSSTIEFRPQVAAGGETVITYTVRYTWPN